MDITNDITNQNIESGTALKHIVSDTLIKIGVPSHLKGYYYLIDAILISIKQKDTTRKLYATIAKKYETTSSRVERGIHHVIDVAWINDGSNALKLFIGLTNDKDNHKPTNLEFIAMISDKLSIFDK